MCSTVVVSVFLCFFILMIKEQSLLLLSLHGNLSEKVPFSWTVLMSNNQKLQWMVLCRVGPCSFFVCMVIRGYDVSAVLMWLLLRLGLKEMGISSYSLLKSVFCKWVLQQMQNLINVSHILWAFFENLKRSVVPQKSRTYSLQQ